MGSENKNRKITVSHRVFTYTVMVIGTMVVFFAVISAVAAKVMVSSDSYVNMVNESSVISGIVSDFMRPKISEAFVAAENETLSRYVNSVGSSTSFEDLANTVGYNEVRDILNDITNSDRDVVSAWVAAERSGSILANGGRFIPSVSYSLHEKYWHQTVVSSKGIVCTSVDESLFDNAMSVVTIIAPVYGGGEVSGFVGLEVKVDGLTRIIEQYTFGSGCYPIISCNYGTVVYYPHYDKFTKKYDINNSPLLNVLIHSESYANGIDSYSGGAGIDGTVYFNVDNVSVPGWSIIVLFDNVTINSGIYGFMLVETLVLICLATIALIFLRGRIRSETETITKFDNAVSDIASGNYKHVETDYGARNEITDSFEKLNRIADALNEKNKIIKEYVDNDTLTGLPNRMSMYNKLESLIEQYSEGGEMAGNRFALMFVDIDNFKWLNETLGHNFGDAVLSTFSKVLSGALNKVGTVYRFSGDEFIILVEFGNDYEKIHGVIHELQNAFSRQIHVMTDNIYLKFSMGVSIFPDDDNTADMLLRDADLALHRAKESGKDRVSFYTNRDKNQNFSKAAIAQQIVNALHDGEMYLNFQPIISAESCDLHGFEVLLRWQNTSLGNISPTEFINVAEESGAIVQIGMWIFENSCRLLKEMTEKCRNDIILSINVSAVQLRREDYIESVKRVIDITQVSPKNLQFEITESTLVDLIGSDRTVIDQIDKLGIAIAIDDFGTGYSSLNYLKNLPVKCLKIDKSFVDEISNDKKDYTITDSIIDLVHNLGIKTVAEGIETVGQYNFLKEMKCDYIQGFLMSKPLDEDAALEFVEMYDALHKPDSIALAEHERQLADEKRQQPEASGEPEKSETILVDEFISK